MSARTLREAAQKMRELADAATPVPWVRNGRNGLHTQTGSCIALSHSHDDDRRRADADHIGAWHPDVARAVAHWLDWTADMHGWDHYPADAVARAFLGKEAAS